MADDGGVPYEENCEASICRRWPVWATNTWVAMPLHLHALRNRESSLARVARGRRASGGFEWRASRLSVSCCGCLTSLGPVAPAAWRSSAWIDRDPAEPILVQTTLRVGGTSTAPRRGAQRRNSSLILYRVLCSSHSTTTHAPEVIGPPYRAANRPTRSPDFGTGGDCNGDARDSIHLQESRVAILRTAIARRLRVLVDLGCFYDAAAVLD